MKPWQKIALFELWLFVAMPVLASVAMMAAGAAGRSVGVAMAQFACIVLFFLWAWEWYAFLQYRHCRQEEFLFLVQTAAQTQAPLEQVLAAYLADRPRERFFRFALLFFVFPGYYWIHLDRSFDARLRRLLKILDQGVSLHRALTLVPGIAARETALAAAVGEYSGKLGQAMNRLPDGRTSPLWAELLPRLLYPLLLLGVMWSNLAFIVIFIMPKFEKIFLEFRMRLPYATELLIHVSRFGIAHPFLMLFLCLLGLALVNALVFSSRVRWHFPLVCGLYRMKARGEFLQMLGIMLETGKPLHEILDRMLESNLLPTAVATRVHGLLADLLQGQPLPESLVRHELASGAVQGLIASAQKTNKLPWALQELGDTLIRRGARYSYRVVAVAFPMMILACAAMIGFIAVSLFLPLIELLGGLSGG